MKKLIIQIVCTIISFQVFAQQNTTPFQPLIWLRADIPGDSAGMWTDYSGNKHHAYNQSFAGFTETALFNFNRSFVFKSNSSALWVDYLPPKNAKLTLFVVYSAEDSLNEYGLWNINLDTGSYVRLSTQNIKNIRKNIRYISTTSTNPIINSLFQSWRLKHVDTLVAKLYIAGSDSLPFLGKYAEFMLFDGSLKNYTLSKVHTYLALKYGIGLIDKDYMDSRDTVLWSYKANGTYKNNIAGIGKDSILYIDQKQSSGDGGNAILKIAAGTLKGSNTENTTFINQGDFLIWGDNGKSLKINQLDSTQTDTLMNLSPIRWLIQGNGNTANNIVTQVIVNTAGMDSTEIKALVINRKGDNIFDTISSIIVYPDSIDFNRNYYFTGILWDVDNSGSDIFTFQLKEKKSTQKVIKPNQNTNGSSGSGINKTIEYSLFPNPTTGNFQLHVSLQETSRISVKIHDAGGKLVKEYQKDGSLLYQFEGELRESGYYLVTVSTLSESISFKLIVK